MGILDIVVLSLALICAIVGTVKGFVKGFLGTLGGIIALVAAYFLCDMVSDWISGTGFGKNIIGSIAEWFTSKGEAFSQTITSEEQLVTALNTLGIPSFLHTIILGTIDITQIQGQTIADFLSPKIAGVAFSGIAYSAIFLAARLVIWIIQKIFSKIVQMSALGVVDRIFGFVWGVVKAAVIVSFIFLIVSLIITLPFGESINNWITADLDKGFGVAKYLYTNNPLIWLYEKIKHLI